MSKLLEAAKTAEKYISRPSLEAPPLPLSSKSEREVISILREAIAEEEAKRAVEAERKTSCRYFMNEKTGEKIAGFPTTIGIWVEISKAVYDDAPSKPEPKYPRYFRWGTRDNRQKHYVIYRDSLVYESVTACGKRTEVHNYPVDSLTKDRGYVELTADQWEAERPISKEEAKEKWSFVRGCLPSYIEEVKILDRHFGIGEKG